MLKYKVLLNEEIDKNNKWCCKMIVTDNKKSVRRLWLDYEQKMINAIENKVSKFYFYIDEVIENKKIAKISLDPLGEAIFEMSWYVSDNNIEDFEIIIVTKDEMTKAMVEKICREYC